MDSKQKMEERLAQLMSLLRSEEGMVQIRVQYMLLGADSDPTVSRLLRATPTKMIEAILKSEFPDDDVTVMEP
jgi:hypothetical protein